MISIAMATYNGGRFIRLQLDSILCQTLAFDELVICDDCSTDDTVEILQEYRDKDSRIKIFINDHNIGFNRNFQKAIGLCEGDYIALSDQDDIWLPLHLEVLSNQLDSGALLAVGGTKFIDENGIILSDRTMAQARNYPLQTTRNSDIFMFVCGYMNPFQGASMMGKKEFFNIALPLPESAYLYDVWFTMCASLMGVLSFNPEIISYWRRHGKNATKNQLHHNPLRTLFGHIVKSGQVNSREDMLNELEFRLGSKANERERNLIHIALKWSARRNNVSGRLRNSIYELRFWKRIHS